MKSTVLKSPFELATLATLTKVTSYKFSEILLTLIIFKTKITILLNLFFDKTKKTLE